MLSFGSSKTPCVRGSVLFRLESCTGNGKQNQKNSRSISTFSFDADHLLTVFILFTLRVLTILALLWKSGVCSSNFHSFEFLAVKVSKGVDHDSGTAFPLVRHSQKTIFPFFTAAKPVYFLRGFFECQNILQMESSDTDNAIVYLTNRTVNVVGDAHEKCHMRIFSVMFRPWVAAKDIAADALAPKPDDSSPIQLNVRNVTARDARVIVDFFEKSVFSTIPARVSESAVLEHVSGLNMYTETRVTVTVENSTFYADEYDQSLTGIRIFGVPPLGFQVFVRNCTFQTLVNDPDKTGAAGWYGLIDIQMMWIATRVDIDKIVFPPGTTIDRVAIEKIVSTRPAIVDVRENSFEAIISQTIVTNFFLATFSFSSIFGESARLSIVNNSAFVSVTGYRVLTTAPTARLMGFVLQASKLALGSSAVLSGNKVRQFSFKKPSAGESMPPLLFSMFAVQSVLVANESSVDVSHNEIKLMSVRMCRNLNLSQFAPLAIFIDSSTLERGASVRVLANQVTLATDLMNNASILTFVHTYLLSIGGSSLLTIASNTIHFFGQRLTDTTGIFVHLLSLALDGDSAAHIVDNTITQTTHGLSGCVIEAVRILTSRLPSESGASILIRKNTFLSRYTRRNSTTEFALRLLGITFSGDNVTINGSSLQVVGNSYTAESVPYAELEPSFLLLEHFKDDTAADDREVKELRRSFGPMLSLNGFNVFFVRFAGWEGGSNRSSLLRDAEPPIKIASNTLRVVLHSRYSELGTVTFLTLDNATASVVENNLYFWPNATVTSDEGLGLLDANVSMLAPSSPNVPLQEQSLLSLGALTSLFGISLWLSDDKVGQIVIRENSIRLAVHHSAGTTASIAHITNLFPLHNGEMDRKDWEKRSQPFALSLSLDLFRLVIEDNYLSTEIIGGWRVGSGADPFDLNSNDGISGGEKESKMTAALQFEREKERASRLDVGATDSMMTDPLAGNSIFITGKTAPFYRFRRHFLSLFYITLMDGEGGDGAERGILISRNAMDLLFGSEYECPLEEDEGAEECAKRFYAGSAPPIFVTRYWPGNGEGMPCHQVDIEGSVDALPFYAGVVLQSIRLKGGGGRSGTCVVAIENNTFKAYLGDLAAESRVGMHTEKGVPQSDARASAVDLVLRQLRWARDVRAASQTTCPSHTTTPLSPSRAYPFPLQVRRISMVFVNNVTLSGGRADVVVRGNTHTHTAFLSGRGTFERTPVDLLSHPLDGPDYAIAAALGLAAVASVEFHSFSISSDLKEEGTFEAADRLYVEEKGRLLVEGNRLVFNGGLRLHQWSAISGSQMEKETEKGRGVRTNVSLALAQAIVNLRTALSLIASTSDCDAAESMIKVPATFRPYFSRLATELNRAELCPTTAPFSPSNRTFFDFQTRQNNFSASCCQEGTHLLFSVLRGHEASPALVRFVGRTIISQSHRLLLRSNRVLCAGNLGPASARAFLPPLANETFEEKHALFHADQHIPRTPSRILPLWEVASIIHFSAVPKAQASEDAPQQSLFLGPKASISIDYTLSLTLPVAALFDTLTDFLSRYTLANRSQIENQFSIGNTRTSMGQEQFLIGGYFHLDSVVLFSSRSSSFDRTDEEDQAESCAVLSSGSSFSARNGRLLAVSSEALASQQQSERGGSLAVVRLARGACISISSSSRDTNTTMSSRVQQSCDANSFCADDAKGLVSVSEWTLDEAAVVGPSRVEITNDEDRYVDASARPISMTLFDVGGDLIIDHLREGDEGKSIVVVTNNTRRIVVIGEQQQANGNEGNEPCRSQKEEDCGSLQRGHMSVLGVQVRQSGSIKKVSTSQINYYVDSAMRADPPALSSLPSSLPLLIVERNDVVLEAFFLNSVDALRYVMTAETGRTSSFAWLDKALESFEAIANGVRGLQGSPPRVAYLALDALRANAFSLTPYGGESFMCSSFVFMSLEGSLTIDSPSANAKNAEAESSQSLLTVSNNIVWVPSGTVEGSSKGVYTTGVKGSLPSGIPSGHIMVTFSVGIKHPSCQASDGGANSIDNIAWALPAPIANGTVFLCNNSLIGVGSSPVVPGGSDDSRGLTLHQDLWNGFASSNAWLLSKVSPNRRERMRNGGTFYLWVGCRRPHTQTVTYTPGNTSSRSLSLISMTMSSSNFSLTLSSSRPQTSSITQVTLTRTEVLLDANSLSSSASYSSRSNSSHLFVTSKSSTQFTASIQTKERFNLSTLSTRLVSPSKTIDSPPSNDGAANNKWESERKEAERVVTSAVLAGGAVTAPRSGGQVAIAMAVMRIAKVCGRGEIDNKKSGERDDKVIQNTEVAQDKDDTAGEDSESLSPFIHPLAFSVGSGRYRYHVGAALSNCVILPIASFLLIRWPIAWLLRFVIAWGRKSSNYPHSFSDPSQTSPSPDLDDLALFESLSTVRRAVIGWPSILFLLLSVLAEGTSAVAVELMFSNDEAGLLKLVGVGVAAVLLASAGVWLFVLVRILMRLPLTLVRRKERCFPSLPQSSSLLDFFSSFLNWLIEPFWERLPATRRPLTAREACNDADDVGRADEERVEASLDAWAHLYGGGIFLWVEYGCVLCAIAVGVLEGMANLDDDALESPVGCGATVSLMLIAVGLQCVLSCMTMVPAEFIVQLAISACVITLMCSAAFAEFAPGLVSNDNETNAEAEEMRGLISAADEEVIGVVVNFLGFFGMILGFVIFIMGLIARRKRVHAAGGIVRGKVSRRRVRRRAMVNHNNESGEPELNGSFAIPLLRLVDSYPSTNVDLRGHSPTSPERSLNTVRSEQDQTHSTLSLWHVKRRRSHLGTASLMDEFLATVQRDVADAQQRRQATEREGELE